jgi:hypothetical protein
MSVNWIILVEYKDKLWDLVNTIIKNKESTKLRNL